MFIYSGESGGLLFKQNTNPDEDKYPLQPIPALFPY